MSQSAAVAVKPVAVSSESPKVAAVFNLDDPNECRIQRAIQIIYGHETGERLRAIRRGTVGGMRMVWTLGSARAQRKREPEVWAVMHFAIDETSIRIERCPDEASARAAFNNAEHASPHLPGIKVPPKR